MSDTPSSASKSSRAIGLSPIEKPAFATLLPAGRWGTLIYLKAELHYLGVVTDKGRQLILYNLKDAIDELPADAGFQPHRSYWVAQDQVQGFKMSGRQGSMLMSNGEWVPVSRRKVSLLHDLQTPELDALPEQ